MDPDDWQHLIVAILALFIVVASGVALTIVGQATNQKLVPDSKAITHKGSRSTRSIVNPRRAMASAMLLVQILAAVVASSHVTELINETSDRDLSWIAILVVAVIYLVFGLALPRAIAEKNLDRLSDRVLSVGRGVTTILKPIEWLVDRAADAFRSLLSVPKIDETDVGGTEDELRHSRFADDDGVIGENERQMIDGILSLEEMTVRDIMVPRLDIVALDRKVSARDMIETITQAGHSRIPVYRESIDNVLGVLYVKDLLPFVIGNTIRIPLLDLIRPAFVVPESKKLGELFTELKRTRIHIAIVADEYGGTAGLVTIEDILEEIVGEIQDEYDTETPLFEKGDADSIVADGRLPIEDVEEALGVKFEDDDDFGTLGGFVHKHLGRLAVQGDTFEAENVRVEILEVERHRVRKMRITKLEPPQLELIDEPKERSDRWRRSSDSSDDSEQPDATG